MSDLAAMYAVDNDDWEVRPVVSAWINFHYDIGTGLDRIVRHHIHTGLLTELWQALTLLPRLD